MIDEILIEILPLFTYSSASPNSKISYGSCYEEGRL